MGSRDYSIDCPTCGESYGGMNAESKEHECDPARIARIKELLERYEQSDYDVIANWPPELVHNLITDGGETCDDDRCWWHVGRPALQRLAANLSHAAQLCASFHAYPVDTQERGNSCHASLNQQPSAPLASSCGSGSRPSPSSATNSAHCETMSTISSRPATTPLTDSKPQSMRSVGTPDGQQPDKHASFALGSEHGAWVEDPFPDSEPWQPNTKGRAAP